MKITSALISFISLIVITITHWQDQKLYKDYPELIKNYISASNNAPESIKFTGISSIVIISGILYPDGRQISDNIIHITYDYGHRGDIEILMTNLLKMIYY